MNGLILAGGNGTRLGSLTKGVNKHLLAIYDKPMIYYAISTLILAGVTDFFIVIRPEDRQAYLNLLGTGAQFGITINFIEQEKANGIAEAPILAEKFLDGQPFWMHLGDNIFYGEGLTTKFEQVSQQHKTTTFIKRVKNPSQFGIVELTRSGNVVNIVEKPREPNSDWAAVGLYFFDCQAVEKAKSLNPSKRNELEITDLLMSYLTIGELNSVKLGRGTTWLDTGNPVDLFEAAQFVKIIQERQEELVGSPEEAAFVKGLIDKTHLVTWLDKMKDSQYKSYLKRLT